MRNFLLPFVLFACLTARPQVAAVQQLLDAVNADSLVWRAQRLTGQVAVDVGSGAQTIVSRNSFQPGNALAEAWLQQEFSRMGYAPTVQAFSGNGANVLAEKPGLVHPERKVIICAHYDAMPGGTTAPGADDDGSGVCAVLEAARVMAGQEFENTVVFALWDKEEQGMLGSAYYASAAAGNDEQITAVVNMDAIGYDGNGDGLMRIHMRPIGNSIAIKDSALMVNDTYGLDLPIAINDPGETYSDHASFWDEGYGAILVIEDFDDDPNPHYHSPTDELQYMDTTYWEGLTLLAIGTVAVLAVPAGPLDIHEMKAQPVFELWPNPAHGSVELRLDGAGAERTDLLLLDATGRVVQEWPMPVASQRIALDGIAPGTYLVRTIGKGPQAAQRLVVMP
ncbi:MAG TPA: M20/M25/M40 family metallo-hydrolase [Flavobacteriales bacterium]|nr:M20/M25/M40 family metallo-hydrolase [Flavobacteriales bacterium]